MIRYNRSCIWKRRERRAVTLQRTYSILHLDSVCSHDNTQFIGQKISYKNLNNLPRVLSFELRHKIDKTIISFVKNI